MKKWIIAIATLTIVLGVQAELITDGGFNDAIYTDGTDYVTPTNSGWQITYRVTGWSNTVDNAAVAAIANKVMGQICAVGDLEGDELQVSFQWTADAGANLSYYLVGWTGEGVDATSYLNLNNAKVIVASASGDLYDFLGNVQMTANGVPTGMVVAGKGSTVNYSTLVSLDPVADISDLAYIGIMFSSDTVGGVLDNVSVVPEPATFGMFGLGALMTVLLRRMRRR